MKCDLANALRQASRAIDPKLDRSAYAYLLEEIAEHVDDVRSGKHTLEEFADFYKLKETAHG